MLITCPECNFTRKVIDGQIPARSQIATCPGCGHRFQFRDLPEEDSFTLEERPTTDSHTPESTTPESPAQSYGPDARPSPPSSDQKESQFETDEALSSKRAAADAADTAKTSTPLQVEVPFEDLENFGFFSGMAQTIKRASLSPKLFFSVMPLKGLLRPLIFGLLIAQFVLVMSAFWQLSGVPDLTDFMLEQQGVATASGQEILDPLLLFLYVPIFYVFNLFLNSSVVHLVMVMVGGAKRGFEGTFRVMAYAQAPAVIGAIPFGLIPAVIWSLTVSFIGLKYMHSTDYSRVALAHVVLVLVVALLFFAPLITTMPGA